VPGSARILGRVVDDDLPLRVDPTVEADLHARLAALARTP
jgi:hypothetical protein